MPRKKLSSARTSTAREHSDSILQGLRTLPELLVLSPAQFQSLADDLTHAAGFASTGFPVPRDDVAGVRFVQQILTADVARAMQVYGLKVSCSRGYIKDGTRRESLAFRIARMTAAQVRIMTPGGHSIPLPFPEDPYRLLKRALKITYN